MDGDIKPIAPEPKTSLPVSSIENSIAVNINLSDQSINTPTSAMPITSLESLKKKKSKKTVLTIIICLALILTTGLVSYKQYAHQNPVDNSKTSARSTVLDQSNSGYSKYEDKDLGYSFIYPKSWGEPVKKSMNDPNYPDRKSSGQWSGSTVDLSFSKVPLFILPIIDGKNNYLVQKAGCFTPISFLNAAKSQIISNTKQNTWEQSIPAVGSGKIDYSNLTTGTQDELVLMNFEISNIVSPTDTCSGLSIFGLKAVTQNSQKLNVVQFLWSTSAQNFGISQSKLTTKDFDDFKANQQKYIKSQDYSDLLKLISSIQSTSSS